MSTKGVSTTAALELVETLCCGERAIPLLVLHDFDKAGFTIAATLQRDTRRYSFNRNVNVIDIGLRLDDVRALDLESSAEDVHDPGMRFFPQGESAAKRRDRGGGRVPARSARRAECPDLRSTRQPDRNQVVESGIRKIVPEKDLLNRTYEAAARTRTIQ
jgi:hypothetical protein